MTNYLVKQSATMLFARGTFSLLAAIAWFLAANHCVVAGFLPERRVAAAEFEGCPGHSSPEKDQESGGCQETSCCKSLAAPVTMAKVAGNYDALSFVTKDFALASGFDLGEQHLAFIEEVDTGPPRSTSFAESVLQRSILAHAPPFCA